MAIEFQCPNGHKLSCGEDRAGRTAKCPKCGVAVQIPAVSTVAAGAATGSGVLPANGGLQPRDSGEVQVGSGIGSNTITFYCPNGHKLSGSPKLAGRTGQCPHCGEKFRIPTREELEAAQPPAAGGVAPANPLSDLWDTGAAPPPAAAQQPAEDEHADEEAHEDEYDAPAAESVEEEAAAGYEYFEMPEDAHPLCRLFDKLWEEKAHGGIVELHIRDAGTLVPDWFERRLSLESHGLFAVQAADGTLTLSAIAWDSVARVVVRNVVALPEGMFE